ncbi:hypothetical protein K438DRAFT_1975278 [Mycena galopus ATCC 62051]|nr:hypothetical protein K438DRAFT_1975278 [Mycena galopus ATCC 62051]
MPRRKTGAQNAAYTRSRVDLKSASHRACVSQQVPSIQASIPSLALAHGHPARQTSIRLDSPSACVASGRPAQLPHACVGYHVGTVEIIWRGHIDFGRARCRSHSALRQAASSTPPARACPTNQARCDAAGPPIRAHLPFSPHTTHTHHVDAVLLPLPLSIPHVHDIATLLEHAAHLKELWQNTIVLGVYDAPLWDALDLVWEVLQGGVDVVAD